MTRPRLYLLLSLLASAASDAKQQTNKKTASIDIDFALTPDTKHIHYLEVALEGPASIDLSNLLFSTGNEESTSSTATAVEVSIVYYDPLKSFCAKVDVDPQCWWLEAGIGSRGEADGETHWCCMEDEMEQGLCAGGNHWERQIINVQQFTNVGKHRFVDIPAEGKTTEQIRNGKIELQPNQSGMTFAILFSSCKGRTVSIKGPIQVTSTGMPGIGFTPIQLFPNPEGVYQMAYPTSPVTSRFVRHFRRYLLMFLVFCVPCFLGVWAAQWWLRKSPSSKGEYKYSAVELSEQTHQYSRMG